MNRKQQSTLHGLFAHQVSTNIDPRLICSVLDALGADVTHGGQGHVVVKHRFQAARATSFRKMRSRRCAGSSRPPASTRCVTSLSMGVRRDRHR